MRQVLLYILLITTLTSSAQPSKYEKDLTTAVVSFYQMTTVESYELAFKRFELISNTNPNDWIPAYYASMIKIKMCLSKMGDQEQLADAGLYWIAKCKKIQLNDEVYCAESMAYTAKMSIRPTARWLLYENKIKAPLELAKKINPKNPRIYTLQANLVYRMPSLFGGGCKAALPLAKKAEKLLLEQGTPISNLPHWGGQAIRELLKACPL